MTKTCSGHNGFWRGQVNSWGPGRGFGSGKLNGDLDTIERSLGGGRADGSGPQLTVKPKTFDIVKEQCASGLSSLVRDRGKGR